MADQWQFSTKAIHSGSDTEGITGATNPPIYQSVGFAHDPDTLEAIFNGRQPGFYYSRSANPTVAALEARLTTLEQGMGAVCVASGMAAITTVFCGLCRTGDNVVVAKSLFGSTYYLFKGVIANLGIEVRFVDTTDVAAYEAAIDTKTQFIFLESIGNPKLDVANIQALSQLAHAHTVPLILDTTFVTPYVCQAKALGVDLVIMSTTKYMCGGGLATGGAVVDTGLFDWTTTKSVPVQSLLKKMGRLSALANFKKVRGTMGHSLSPHNAFLTIKGIETLPLRMDRHCDNALRVARYLSQHDKVTVVRYPGLSDHLDHDQAKTQFSGRYGAMVTVRLGSKKKAYALLNQLHLVRCLVNLGDAKTLAVCPRRTIYRDLTDDEAHDAGVYDDLIRVSIGLEDDQDLIADFEQGLAGV